MSKKQEQEQYRCKTELKRELTVSQVIERMDKYTAIKEAAERREQRREADNQTAKAEVKDLLAQAEELLSECKNRYETSTVEAVARFNRKKGTKRIYHYCPANKELHDKFIHEVDMTEDDWKLLPLGDNIDETAPGRPQADGSVKEDKPSNVEKLVTETGPESEKEVAE